jgi:hypothetical protein
LGQIKSTANQLLYKTNPFVLQHKHKHKNKIYSSIKGGANLRLISQKKKAKKKKKRKKEEEG